MPIHCNNAVQFGGMWIAAPVSRANPDFSNICHLRRLAAIIAQLIGNTDHNAMSLFSQGDSGC